MRPVARGRGEPREGGARCPGWEGAGLHGLSAPPLRSCFSAGGAHGEEALCPAAGLCAVSPGIHSRHHRGETRCPVRCRSVPGRSQVFTRTNSQSSRQPSGGHPCGRNRGTERRELRQLGLASGRRASLWPRSPVKPLLPRPRPPDCSSRTWPSNGPHPARILNGPRPRNLGLLLKLPQLPSGAGSPGFGQSGAAGSGGGSSDVTLGSSPNPKGSFKLCQ